MTPYARAPIGASRIAPLVSVVVPALNERRTVEPFVAWCHEGFSRAGVPGEIWIVDSSDDGTDELALGAGAHVLKVARRGLGAAYREARPWVRGKYAILGDCDCTYDFRRLGDFLVPLERGADFVLGHRRDVEPGAMPALHRYFGIPATGAFLNLLFGTRFSDIHCGMRALRSDFWRRMPLEESGWAYASEMILAAKKLGAKIEEVPIAFYRAPFGRESHHVRQGWWSPWRAGLENAAVTVRLRCRRRFMTP